jgi:Ca2+-binding RTX toxin-like protein
MGVGQRVNQTINPLASTISDNDLVTIKNSFFSTISTGIGNDRVDIVNSNVSVYAGAGDDTIRMANAKRADQSFVQGGAGNDTFIIYDKIKKMEVVGGWVQVTTENDSKINLKDVENIREASPSDPAPPAASVSAKGPRTL